MAVVATVPMPATFRVGEPLAGTDTDWTGAQTRPVEATDAPLFWAVTVTRHGPGPASAPAAVLPSQYCGRVGAGRPAAKSSLWSAAVEHPRHAEAILQHPEAERPERLANRHHDVAAFGQRTEDALGLGHLAHGE